MRYSAKQGAALPPGSHPAREAVFAAVARQPGTAPEVAAACGRPLGTVAYHLRVLTDAGLIDELPDADTLTAP